MFRALPAALTPWWRVAALSLPSASAPPHDLLLLIEEAHLLLQRTKTGGAWSDYTGKVRDLILQLPQVAQPFVRQVEPADPLAELLAARPKE